MWGVGFLLQELLLRIRLAATISSSLSTTTTASTVTTTGTSTRKIAGTKMCRLHIISKILLGCRFIQDEWWFSLTGGVPT